ncbi:MAG: efflux RND transporter periplasmic adaptor subunit [Pseudomonadota bacterium]
MQATQTIRPARLTFMQVSLALVLVALAANALAQRAARVKVDAVRSEPLSQTVPILGRFVARERGAVAAAIGGPVRVVHVHVGDRVEAGQLLAELNADSREALLAQREAERSMHQARLTAAEAQLKITTDEMRRLEKLRGSAAFPRKQYEDQRHEVVRYTSALSEARSGLQRTNAELNAANIDLNRSRVIAPYGGVVTHRFVSAGAYLRLGDPVVTLVNDADLEIEADVPADRVSGLTAGVGVEVSLDAGERLTATVRTVIPDENPTTRTRPVRLRVAALAAPAAVNQSVTVHVPVGASRQVLSVHKDAVLNRGGKSLVYVVVEDKATIRPVALGEAVGARLEVLQGLGEGDLVVVRGNERLRPGQAVSFKKG